MTKAAWFLLLGVMAVPAVAQYDAYGGWLKLQGRKTGFFHTETIGGRWWLVSPEGNVFFSKGVCSVDIGRQRNPSPSVPPDQANQLAQAAQQFKQWNFNTVGAWSVRVPGMAYTVNLGLASARSGAVTDYFSPEFRDGADRRAAQLCTPLANDPWLLGYFTDSELRWLPDVRSNDSVLETFLKKAPESPGYQRAVAFLKARGHTPDNITDEDKDGFLELAASEYGRVVQDAVHRHDPNHLILGSKFNNRATIPLSRGVGPYYDVVSYDNYDQRAPIYRLREIAEVTGKPTLIGEFGFKAMDSGLPNSKGAGDAVATQQDRADLFAGYVQDLAALPSCVGFHWFQYRDEPYEGRGDGENSNYGIVKLDGSPWTVLTNRMVEVNGGIEALAAKSGKR
jgi:hypothetical protein